MKIVFSLKSAIFMGKPWLVIADHPREIYEFEEDEMGDPDWDNYPINGEIEGWLYAYIPRWLFHVDNLYCGPGRGVRQYPYVAWNRPVRFTFRRHAQLFKHRWS